jgi:hypothetical protein
MPRVMLVRQNEILVFQSDGMMIILGEKVTEVKGRLTEDPKALSHQRWHCKLR